MTRVIFGFLKGLMVGGGIGFALLRLGWTGSVGAFLGCAVVGALVGVVCGRPPWRSETIWTPVVKAFFGGLVGVGLCALGVHFLSDATLLTLPDAMTIKLNGGPLLATAIGVIYGIFVEVDDGGAAAEQPARGKGKALPEKKQAKLASKSED